MSFAYQNETTFAMERLVEGASYAYKEQLGLLAALDVCRRFDAGLPGFSAEDYARQWNVPTRLLNETFRLFEESRILVQSASKPPIFQPARSIDKISVADVTICLREAGEDPSALRQDPILRRAVAAAIAFPGGPEACSMADLVRLTTLGGPDGGAAKPRLRIEEAG